MKNRTDKTVRHIMMLYIYTHTHIIHRHTDTHTHTHLGFPGDLVVKILPAIKRCKFDPWVRKIPWRSKW